jgi:hypothetical protein
MEYRRFVMLVADSCTSPNGIGVCDWLMTDWRDSRRYA